MLFTEDDYRGVKNFNDILVEKFSIGGIDDFAIKLKKIKEEEGVELLIVFDQMDKAIEHFVDERRFLNSAMVGLAVHLARYRSYHLIFLTSNKFNAGKIQSLNGWGKVRLCGDWGSGCSDVLERVMQDPSISDEFREGMKYLTGQESLDRRRLPIIL